MLPSLPPPCLQSKDLLPLCCLAGSELADPTSSVSPSFIINPSGGGGGKRGGLWGQTGDKITSCDAIVNISELFLENRLLKIASFPPQHTHIQRACNLIGEAIKKRPGCLKGACYLSRELGLWGGLGAAACGRELSSLLAL